MGKNNHALLSGLIFSHPVNGDHRRSLLAGPYGAGAGCIHHINPGFGIRA